jgi:hypothetical protein
VEKVCSLAPPFYFSKSRAKQISKGGKGLQFGSTFSKGGKGLQFGSTFSKGGKGLLFGSTFSKGGKRWKKVEKGRFYTNGGP